jgi:hypothetical protein
VVQSVVRLNVELVDCKSESDYKNESHCTRADESVDTNFVV